MAYLDLELPFWKARERWNWCIVLVAAHEVACFADEHDIPSLN
jgi:hypothetical protein